MSAANSTRVNPRVKDLTGQVFGRLTVVSFTKGKRCDSAYWKCKCDCGNDVVVLGYSLSSGNTKSCGCLMRETTRASFTTHGYRKTRTYRAWMSMKYRCQPWNKQKQNYYDRGIRVCDRWDKFENFLLDMGECQDGFELDRINNNKGYEPGNCRWTDEVTQARNKRNIKYYEYGGRSMILTDWAKYTGIDRRLIAGRINRFKWSFERAITTPVSRTI